MPCIRAVKTTAADYRMISRTYGNPNHEQKLNFAAFVLPYVRFRSMLKTTPRIRVSTANMQEGRKG